VRLAVEQVLALGDEVRISARLPGVSDPLHLRAPERLVEELRLAPGAVIEAVLRVESVRILGDNGAAA
jgi:hypothetical protein